MMPVLTCTAVGTAPQIPPAGPSCLSPEVSCTGGQAEKQICVHVCVHAHLVVRFLLPKTFSESYAHTGMMRSRCSHMHSLLRNSTISA
eukprot:scaffold11798_cov19-Tisochrysis_lutea.AAC.2